MLCRCGKALKPIKLLWIVNTFLNDFLKGIFSNSLGLK